MKRIASKAIAAFQSMSGSKGTVAENTVQEALSQLERLERVLFDSKGRKYVSYERMEELLKADAEGKVIILPCHLQEKMYRVQVGHMSDGNIKTQVRRITVGESNFYRLVFEEELGRTVFTNEDDAIAEARRIKKELEGKVRSKRNRTKAL